VPKDDDLQIGVSHRALIRADKTEETAQQKVEERPNHGAELSQMRPPSFDYDRVSGPHGYAISERAARSLDELAAGSSVRTVIWHDSNEYGDVLCEVRDKDGIVLGVNVGPDLDDAILNLADDLMPPER